MDKQEIGNIDKLSAVQDTDCFIVYSESGKKLGKLALADLPAATEQKQGLMTPSLLNGFIYKELPLKKGTTIVIGKVSGLMTIEIPYQVALPGIYLVSPNVRKIKLIALEAGGFDYTNNSSFALAFNGNNELTISSNNYPYDVIVYIAYQYIGFLKA